MDFDEPESWGKLLALDRIDVLMATDVIYQAVIVENLAKLMRTIKQKHPDCRVEIIIPTGRVGQENFLEKMRE